MLSRLREASKSWVAAIFMGLLVLSFAIWGINDIFSGRSSTAVAVVAGTEISADAYTAEYRRRIDQLRRQQGLDLDPQMARALGYDRQVLEQMIVERALIHYAAGLKLTASDAQVREQIRAIPAFNGIAGGFDRNQFQRVLYEMGYSESYFVQLVRNQIVGDQLLGTTTLGAFPPPGYIAAMAEFANERRVVEYFAIKPERAGTVADPGDEALKAFIEANKERFTAPEYRKLAWLAVSPAAMAAKVEVTEEELKAAYERARAQYVVPAKFQLEQISFKTEDEAKAARARIAAGASFAKVAADAGFKPDEIAIGEVREGDPSVPAEAFALKANQVSAPLKGPFGWVLIRCVKLTPGSEKTYDEVKQEIRDAIAKDRAGDLVYDATNAIEDALAGGSTLEEAAAAQALPLGQAEAVDAQGRDAKGAEPSGLLADPAFLKAAFETNSGEESEVTPAQDGTYFIVRVDGVTPSAVKPFEAIRAEALAAYTAAERQKKLDEIAQGLVAKGNAGSEIAPLAAEAKAKVVKSPRLARDGGETKIFAPGLLSQLFASPKGTFVSGAAAEGEAVIVARVIEIGQAKPEDNPAKPEEVLTEIQREYLDDIGEQFTAAVRADAGVEIDEEMFQRLSGAPTE